MLVGFDTEYGFRSFRHISGRFEPDTTTGVPVCACLAFEDGREAVFSGDYASLAAILADPQYEFVVHGAHAEMQFCRLAKIPFPERYIDTLLRGLLLAHATSFEPVGGAYSQTGLATLTSRFGIPFIGAGEKDAIRDSIFHLKHMEEFGTEAVTNYCMADARACLQLVRPIRDAVNRNCGPTAENNIAVLYQPYAQVMAETAAKGIRFDQDGWCQLLEWADAFRQRQLRIMSKYGYDHDGDGLGLRAFERMIIQLGFDRSWPRTPTGRLRTQESDLKDRKHLHEAIRATHSLVRFDAVMGQRLGDRVDSDGRIRCGILPFAQRSSRNSTIRPNLMGIPGELRPLLLPDEGCRFVHFDYSQQEPGVAAYLSGDSDLMDDFMHGDVYVNTGRRMGLVTANMTPDAVRAIRNGLLKSLILAVIYGKSATGIARDLPCSLHQANVQLARLGKAYPRLFQWLRCYVCTALEQGWAENVIGYRAAFTVGDPQHRSHVARSAQNFPIQSSAATCFQVTGLHLAWFGADIRLPIHDAYILNVPDDPKMIVEAREQVIAATEDATNQLFPGLPVKRDIEVLGRFAKDAQENSFCKLIASLKAEENTCLVD